MAIQKPEWFRLDAAKFLSDRVVDAMSTLELGTCTRLMCRQWIDGYIPDDPALLARLSRLDNAAMTEALPLLSQFFPVVEPGKRANRFMWVERDRVIGELERKSDDGARAARKRWDEVRNQRNASPNARANGSAMPEPIQDQSRADQSRESANAPPRPPAKMRGHNMPDDFRPNDSHRALAAKLGVDLDAAFEKFRDYHLSKGSKYVDWGRALNNWLRNEKEFTRGSTNGKAVAQITGSAVENTLALLKAGER